MKKATLRAAIATQERIITNLSVELESVELSNVALRAALAEKAQELAFWTDR